MDEEKVLLEQRASPSGLRLGCSENQSNHKICRRARSKNQTLIGIWCICCTSAPTNHQTIKDVIKVYDTHIGRVNREACSCQGPKYRSNRAGSVNYTVKHTQVKVKRIQNQYVVPEMQTNAK